MSEHADPEQLKRVQELNRRSAGLPVRQPLGQGRMTDKEGDEAINAFIRSRPTQPAPADMNAWIRNRGRAPAEEED